MSDVLGEFYAAQKPFKGDEIVLSFIEVLLHVVKVDGILDRSEVRRFMGIILERPPFGKMPEEKLVRMIRHAGELSASQGVGARMQSCKAVLDHEARLLAFQLAFEISHIDGEVDESELKALKELQATFELSEAEVAQQLDAVLKRETANASAYEKYLT